MSDGTITLIGAGFVADLYARALPLYPDLRVAAVWDRDPDRLRAFCTHWNLPAAESLDAALAATPADGLVLNLTNPAAHHEINAACIDAGHHVYCEKPLALDTAAARDLSERAKAAGLQLGSAPCSVLGEAAQTLGHAIRTGVAGTPRAIYAELDDGFVPQAAYRKWITESGAPWPFEDEFRTGCTLEHAGYYLSWLIAWFGPVRTVVAASAETIPGKEGTGPMAADLSVATLFFEDGPVTRLTCSIVAPHDHRIRVIGDGGVLETRSAWDNAAQVTYRRRLTLRRKLMESPWPRRHRLSGRTHPKVKRWGAAAMNFLLGPVEMLEAIGAGRPSRIAGDYAVHLTEVTLAIQYAGETSGAQAMTTRCAPMEPMPWAR
ncbi:Gfo/Idh/MocA family protein [Roseivivax sediminis]|uniref:Predicted dehydrogenase n=1 Tax=Roseivivax sediminis TaxID=936889 RepID=A0A1I1UN19_9RHOB|nr:Gfo/Idh/MocA family oxidoreductase [Roseivivax sediminis]SFD71975.1 Predicted dehydrogenase [Roseivivax sediminis]